MSNLEFNDPAIFPKSKVEHFRFACISVTEGGLWFSYENSEDLSVSHETKELD